MYNNNASPVWRRDVNEAVRSTMRVVVSTAGGVIAGPVGVMVGSMLGGLLSTVLPGGSALVESMIKALTTKGIESASKQIVDRLQPEEKQLINHDLQTAFRDALREALFDIGGRECFPDLPANPVRDIPSGVCYADTGHGKALWRRENPLRSQIADLLQSLRKALDDDKILPLNPPADQLSASVMAFLQAETPRELEKLFFDQNILPQLAKYRSLLQEVPDLEPHLRLHLYSRTMVHFAEHLKHRTPAWRAFNRIVLEELQVGVGEIKEGQSEILARLDILLKERDGRAITEFSNGMADLLTAMAGVEKAVNESYETLSARVVAQHREILDRFDRLAATADRIEGKVDQVLSVLQAGRPSATSEPLPTIPLRKPPAPGEPPYKGLQSFGEVDADWFYGREVLTARLIERLQGCHFLTIIGASGSGKSSLVQAGLIPVLKGNKVLTEVPLTPRGSVGWPVHIITPGEHPLETLAASFTRNQGADQARALAENLRQDPGSLSLAASQDAAAANAGGVLLIVDQFEELFTLCDSTEERAEFIRILLNAGGPETKGSLMLVLVLRADFYAECAQFDELRAAISSHQEYIGPMSPEELRRAIELPARKGGWRFEPGLVDLMIEDAGSEPGALPLLSHALLETWNRRSGHTMLMVSYHEAGGVKGAIARTAEWILTQRLSASQQLVARNIFLRLTSVSEGVQETRRKAALDELLTGTAGDESRQEVLDLLVDARLVTVEEGTVQVAHEALIREWPRLRGWIDENRTGLRIQRRLTEASAEWQRLMKDEGLLYRGVRLSEAQEWARTNPEGLNPLEAEFLAESTHLVEREQRQREEQQQRELEAAQKLAEAERQKAENEARSAAQLKRRAVYLTAALGGVGLLVILAVILMISALNNGRQAARNAATAEAASTQAVAQQATAEAERARAELEVQHSNARQLSALSQNALLENSPQRSLLLAIEANDLARSSADPDGLFLANSLWQSITGTGGLPLLHQDHSIYVLSLSPDNRWLASAALNEPIKVWDLQASDPQANPISLSGHTDFISGLVFTPDGRHLYSASYDGSVRRWDLSAADPALTVLTANPNAGKVQIISVSGDGSRVITGCADGSLAIWNFARGSVASPELALKGHQKPIFAMALSQDDRWLLTGDSGGEVRLWDLKSQDPQASMRILPGHESAVYATAISPDGHWAATGGEDDLVHLWDLTAPDLAGSPILLSGHSQYIGHLVFSPDSRWLVSGSGDATLRRWDLKAVSIQDSSLTFSGHTDDIWGVKISLDGKWLISFSLDHNIRVWPLATVSAVPGMVFSGHDSVVTAAIITSDSHYLYSSSDDASIRRWDLTAASPLSLPILLQGHTVGINDLAFALDGLKLYSAGADGTIGVWDLKTNQRLETWKDHTKSIYSFSLNADQTRLATAGFDGQVSVYDLTAPQDPLLWKLSGFADPVVGTRFSNDGRWLYVISQDGTLRSYDLTAADVKSSGVSVLAHQNGIQFLGLSPDGRWLATGGWDWFVRLWDLKGAGLTKAAYELENCTGPLAFSRDGSTLAAVCDTDVRTWSMRDPSAEPRILAGSQGLVYILGLSPDGRWLAVAGDYGMVWIWDLQSNSNQPAFTLRGHINEINTLTYTPDSRYIITAAKDQTVRVWDLSSPDPSAASLILRTPQVVYSLAVSQDNNWLATGELEGEIRLWPLDLASVRNTACKLAGRNFNTVEWAAYFPGVEYRKTCP